MSPATIIWLTIIIVLIIAVAGKWWAKQESSGEGDE